MVKLPKYRFFKDKKTGITRITRRDYTYVGLMAMFKKGSKGKKQKGIFTDKWRPLKITKKE